MRNAQAQAGRAADTAANTGANLGASASGIGSTLSPFLQGELTNPQGYSQQDMSGMLAASEAGAGGANSGIVGQANQTAAVTRNAGGFQAALSDAARQRDKAAALGSEGIASRNADLKSQQQQDAAQGLQRMYGTDTSGMLDAMGQVPGDVNAQANAGSTGWLQNTLGLIGTLRGGRGY